MTVERKGGLGPEDWWLAAWLCLLPTAAGVLMGINALRFHYTGIAYFQRPAVAVVFPLLELVAFSVCARGLSARAAFVVRNYASFLLLVCAISILTTGIQYTPFAPFDGEIAAWDARLHFHVTDVMAWTCAHPWFRRPMQISYAALNAEIFLVPLFAALCADRRRMRVFLYAAAYSYLAGGMFYYFFPSSGPASLLASPYFSWEQRLTGAKFYQVHHFQPVTTVFGGMVAFPSFHAVWAILLTYAAASKAKLFYPALLLNVLVVLSTVLLGWHFLSDVAASAALASSSLWVGERTHRWLSSITIKE